VDVHNEGVKRVVERYKQECRLMSNLRHPNITQFLGISFVEGTKLPLLVMELLETNLDSLLEHMPNLPLSLKHSILEDVASGLLYLHDRPSPVIHRDLTARNVLLSSSLVAKITDMGNSRIIDMKGKMASSLTNCPGTAVYMPPEALEPGHYGPSMDVFSFGHLALFTLTQV
jgi:serine/threonine protein kinase